MRVVLVLMSGVVLSGALGACASGTPAAGPTVTVTATQTVTATPEPAESSASPAADPREALFDKGYPKVVETTEIPDYMQGSVDGDQVVQIAPGVWTEFVEGIDPVDLAVDGSPFGLCAATTKWERTLLNAGFNPGGSTCW